MAPANDRRNLPSVLFAEDDDSWSFLFLNEFRKLAPDWGITCVPDGSKAVRFLIDAPAPVALITDLNMPGMGGLELIEWVRDQPQFQQLPIVVISSSTDPAHRLRCDALGISNFFDKPRSLDDLRDKIRDILKLGE